MKTMKTTKKAMKLMSRFDAELKNILTGELAAFSARNRFLSRRQQDNQQNLSVA